MTDETKSNFSATVAEIVAKRTLRPPSSTKDRPWTMGFGPVLFKAGETRRIDTQPKCYFRAEKILAHYDTLTDVHLLGLYVGREEILKLDGDSIDLGAKKETAVETKQWSQPALPIEVEIVNRSSEDRMIALDIVGTTRL